MEQVSFSVERTNGTATILVVDDEALIRTAINRMLQAIDCQILNATNGNEALAICEQWKGAIHLMLTDVMMPGMNGFDLADHVTKRWPSIKILFISGFATDAAIRRRTSNHPLLQKPFTRDQLTCKVRELLKRSARMM
jgi:CheY-like chemotaxis protein